MKCKIKCDMCGKLFERERCWIHNHNFCSVQCRSNFSSKRFNPDGYWKMTDHSKVSAHLSALNRKLNPTRMTPATRKKLRMARLNSGEGKTYTKLYGRHEHRVVAEKMLGAHYCQMKSFTISMATSETTMHGTCLYSPHHISMGSSTNVWQNSGI